MKDGHESIVVRRCGTNMDIPSARNYFDLHINVLAELPYSMIEKVASELVRAYREGHRTYLFGNGGSAALASHFACDLGKGTVRDRAAGKRFRAVSLTDNIPLITAWANDSSYEDVFSEQLQSLLAAGDIAFAISGSGNSPNVLRALRVAKASGGTTIGMTGYSGGKLKALCDHCIVVPSDNMQVIEDFHLSVSHALFTRVCHYMREPARLGAAAGAALQSD
jgi:D-sedoheptulose 7-phosphate isomerase